MTSLKNMIFLAVPFLFVNAAAFAGQEPQSAELNFRCTIEAYNVVDGKKLFASEKIIVQPFGLKAEQKPVEVSTNEQDTPLTWKISIENGMLVAQVTDADDKVLAVSKTEFGHTLELDIPSVLQILKCSNHVKKPETESFRRTHAKFNESLEKYHSEFSSLNP